MSIEAKREFLENPSIRWIVSGNLELVIPKNSIGIEMSLDNGVNQPLHIPCVDVLHMDRRLCEPTDLEIEASSLFGREGRNIRQGLPGSFRIDGEHTSSELNPWIRVTWCEVDVKTLVLIRNRMDRWGWRNNGLEVRVILPNGERRLVFSHYHGIDQAVEFFLASSLALAHQTARATIFRALVREISDLRIYFFDNAHLVHKPWSPNSKVLHLINSLNDLGGLIEIELIEELLKTREFAFGGHGLTRQFVYWDYSEKQALARLSLEVIESLKKNGFQSCCGFGTALGMARDQSFISHDDDMDLLVFHEDWSMKTDDYRSKIYEYVELISSILAKEGFTLSNASSHVAVYKDFGGKQLHLDVFPVIRDNGVVLSAAKSFAPIRIDNFQNLYLYNVLLPFPDDLESYCRSVYGESWRIPQTRFRHIWGNSDKSNYR